MTVPGSDHGMFSPGNEAGIDPAYTDLDTLAATVREALDNPGQWARYPNAKTALAALVEHARTLRDDNQRWLAWSSGRYPDDSPGDVISAAEDGTVVLDDAITTWNPLRALAWWVEHARTLERENEHLRPYEDRGDFLVRRTEWDHLHRTINGLREQAEGQRQRIATLERERDEAREDAIDARASAEAARAMRDRHEERYEKHRDRADRYEKALMPISERPCIRGLSPNCCANVLPDRRTWCDRCLARAALAGEDA